MVDFCHILEYSTGTGACTYFNALTVLSNQPLNKNNKNIFFMSNFQHLGTALNLSLFFFFYKKYNYGYYKKYNYGYNFLNMYNEENFKNKQENLNPEKRNSQSEMVHDCTIDFQKNLLQILVCALCTCILLVSCRSVVPDLKKFRWTTYIRIR